MQTDYSHFQVKLKEHIQLLVSDSLNTFRLENAVRTQRFERS